MRNSNMLQEQMNWHAGQLAMHESDWIALHRFLWLNSLDAKGLWRLLCRRDGKRQYLYNCNVWDIVAKMQSWHVTAAAGKWISERSLAHLLGNELQSILLSDGVRFCPQCLALGFHSPIFYFPSLKTCPFHGCLLENTCPSCRLRFSPGLSIHFDFKHPFGCSHCAAPFVSMQHSGATELGSQAQMVATFSAVSQALARMGVRKSSLRGLCSERSLELPLIRGIVSECIFTRAGIDALPPNGFIHPRTPRTTQRPMREERTGYDALPLGAPCLIADAWPQHQAELRTSLSAVLKERVAVAKSLNRYFGKCVKRICGHRRTPMLACIKNDATTYNVPYEVLMKPTDCPACATLDWWRAEISKVIALKKHVLRIEKSRSWLVDDSEATYRGRFLLNEPDFSNALRTIFTRMATSMRELISPVGDEALNYAIYQLTTPTQPSRVRRMESLSGWEYENWHLRLPVSRYHIEPAEVWLDDTVFSFTMKSAWAALKESVQLRRQGPLWGPMMPVEADRKPFASRSFWYFDVGKASLGRFLVADDLSVRRREPLGQQLELFESIGMGAYAAKEIPLSEAFLAPL